MANDGSFNDDSKGKDESKKLSLLDKGKDKLKQFSGSIASILKSAEQSSIKVISDLSGKFIGAFSQMGIGAINSVANFVSQYSKNLDLVRQSTDMGNESIAQLLDTFETQMSVMSESSNQLGASIFIGIQEPLQGLAQLGIDAIAELQRGFDEGGLEGMFACAGTVITNLINGFIEQLPLLIEFSLTLLNALIQGLMENIDAITSGATFIMVSLLEALITGLPMIFEFAFQLLNALITGISENMDVIGEGAASIITGFLTSIFELLPTIIECGMQLLISLCNGLLEQAPTLIPTVLTLIGQLIDSFIQNLPELVRMGVLLLQKLIEGIIEAIPEVVAYIPILISTLCTMIRENLPTIIKSGVELVGALVIGLIQAIPAIIRAIPDIISAIWDGLMEVDWLELGINIIKGIISGLSNVGSFLWDAICNIGDNIVSGFKDFFGIASPSKLMRDKIGKMIPLGLEVGVEKQMPKSVEAMTSITAQEMEKFKRATIELSANDYDAIVMNAVSNPGANAFPSKLEIVDKSQNQTSLVLDNGQEIAHWLAPWVGRELGLTKG